MCGRLLVPKSGFLCFADHFSADLDKKTTIKFKDSKHIFKIQEAVFHREKLNCLSVNPQELEAEKAAKKKVEKELRKVQETLEEERGRQKQIILMLVEERKRLALQYVEERKRSEDLAQVGLWLEEWKNS